MNRSEITRMLPHDGSMVLLDRIASCGEREIVCATRSHLDPDNPLRRRGLLPVVCGVEYAAQAMAVHGALNAGSRARPGVLASVRKVSWSTDRLDDVAGELAVRAEVLMAGQDRSIYAFRLQSGDADVLTGEAAVFLL